MKTKEQKFTEFQRELEKNKKRIIWASICILLIAISWGMYGIVFPTKFAWAFYLCYIIFGFGAIINWIERLNMDYEKNKINNPRESKKDALRDFAKKYQDKDIYFVPPYGNSISSEFSQIEHLLINNSGKSPQKIIEIIQEDLEDDLIRMEVYRKSSERNYWQYFLSGKWLKKIR
jgi:hypothetical protein